jgi:Sec-independent protein translocase protein TatA
VLVFGGSAIPKLARNLGSAKTEFEKGLKTAKGADTTTKASDTTEAKAPDTDK